MASRRDRSLFFAGEFDGVDANERLDIVRALLKGWQDGRVKLWLIAELLNWRARNPWFEEEMLPALRQRVSQLLAQNDSP